MTTFKDPAQRAVAAMFRTIDGDLTDDARAFLRWLRRHDGKTLAEAIEADNEAAMMQARLFERLREYAAR